MARFTREYFDNDDSGNEIWRRITGYLRDGAQSVEVLSRIVEGDKVWEIRSWDGIRKTKEGSNAAGAKPSIDY